MDEYTDFTGATLNEVIAYSIKMTDADGVPLENQDSAQPKLPEGYKLINGIIVGPYVDLKTLQIKFPQFDLAEEEGIDLTDMNLRGVNLKGTVLKNAKLD